MKFLDLNEGPEDPGIFRAIFLAGGPGSGKSYAARHLSLSSMGLKTIDSDQAFEYLMQKHDMDMSPGSIASDQGQELRDRAKKLTDLKKQGFLSGRLGVVIDGTAKDPNKILNMKRSLENLGYHTALIFVNTSLRTAMQRNSQRSRRIPGALVADAHKQVQDSLPALKSEFGKDYIEINSDSSDVFDRDIASAKKQLDSFISKPHTKDAKAWINSAKLDKISEEEEPRFKHESDVDIPRKEMPQINIKHVKNNYRVVKGRLALDKIKPSQSQRVPGLTNKVIDRLYKGKMQDKPLIVDKHGYLVNGHHRLDALKHLGAEKTNVVMVDASIQDLIKDFSHTTSDEFAENGRQTTLSAPQNTLIIDKTDDFDFYKLGQHYANISQIDPHELGSGGPDIYITLPNKKERLKLMRVLDKLGVKYRDISGSHEHPEIHSETIRKVKGGYRLLSKKGKNLGTYPSKAGAEKREKQVNYFKHISEGFTKPQLDVEWGEAQRYPEFRKIGKEAWIKLAGKGKAITITDASDINNTDAADPDSFKTLDPAKQKRALAQVEKGDVELPVVAVYSDGYKELIGGNTRLTAMMAKHGKAIVWQFEVPDEVATLAESFNQPYPVKVIQSPDSDDYEAALRLPDGTGMEILFTDHGGIWDMEFYRGGSQDVTGEGDAFRIFATMMEAVRQFIRMEKPGAVSFTATKDVPEGQDPESRAKLYTRMVERFADSLGYDAYIDDYGDMVEYELVNKKHVSKGVDENFKDGKVKGKSRPGRVKKAGASCKGSVSSLRAKAKKYSGEKGKMYHWCANMKSGKSKK